jgi:hypothetical protein
MCTINLVHLQVMLDTLGPELQVFNKNGAPIELEANAFVTLTPDSSREASSEVLPINYAGLAQVQNILQAFLLFLTTNWMLAFALPFCTCTGCTLLVPLTYFCGHLLDTNKII